MIFKQLGEHSGNLIAYKWDFGVPVTFLTEDDEVGFTIGDVIRFELGAPINIKKTFTVNVKCFSFDLFFTKEEANALAASGKSNFIYSIKQYSEKGEFLDTIMEGKLILKETLQWED